MKQKYKVGILVGIILIFLITDYIIGLRQEEFIQQKKATKVELERLAYYLLRTDIENVSYEGNEIYKISIYYDNPYSEELYIANPSTRVFVQVGVMWTEVPTSEDPTTARKPPVVKLVNAREVRDSLSNISVVNFTELIPGYMHVRVQPTVYVALDEMPKDIVERTADIYVYLKPNSSDYIPMPPH